MVRNLTEKTDRAIEQWLAAWQLLPAGARDAVASFCTDADPDVASAVLKL